jgi:cysteine desulfurase/selenocysteine lyase
MDEFYNRLNNNTKLVSILAMSNALGTILPVKAMIDAAKSVGATTLIDGCQSVVHGTTDVKSLDCDFFVFSGHKLYGPDGIGICYGKYEILESMPPYQSGGDMIDRVSFENTSFADPPSRFEAGTPAISQAIGLGAAIDYLNEIDLDAAAAHELNLRQYAENQMTEIDGLKIIGTAEKKGPIISFILDQAHPQDIATLLDKYGVAVRVGHHCCEPLMNRLGLDGTVRASFGLYNTKTDIDQMITGLHKITNMLY